MGTWKGASPELLSPWGQGGGVVTHPCSVSSSFEEPPLLRGLRPDLLGARHRRHPPASYLPVLGVWGAATRPWGPPGRRREDVGSQAGLISKPGSSAWACVLPPCLCLHHSLLGACRSSDQPVARGRCSGREGCSLLGTAQGWYPWEVTCLLQASVSLSIKWGHCPFSRCGCAGAWGRHSGTPSPQRRLCAFTSASPSRPWSDPWRGRKDHK